MSTAPSNIAKHRQQRLNAPSSSSERDPRSLSPDADRSPSADSSEGECKNEVILGILSDVTLTYGTTHFRCHRFALAARSPVFEAMFQDLEAKSIDIPQQKTGGGAVVTAAEFETFLRILYYPERYLGLAVLQSDWNDESIESILHLSHYFGSSVPTECLFLLTVQSCPDDLSARFWQLLFWADRNHVDKIVSALVQHGGSFHRFYGIDAKSGSANTGRKQYHSRLSASTQIQLLEAQVKDLHSEIQEIERQHREKLSSASKNRGKHVFWSLPELKPLKVGTAAEVFVQLKAKIKEAAR